jgi:subtilisin family serine protease
MSRIGGLIAIVCALAVAAPVASATHLLPPPKPSGVGMQWYRWHPSSDALRGESAAFGPTAVIGLEAMRDLGSLRDRYGFAQVRAIPMLHAAEVRAGPTQLRELLAKGPSDRRIRYVSPIGPPRRELSVPNDPFVRDIDPERGVPFEWQFTASHVDRALDFSQGDPRIAVGVINSGVVAIPDLAGKIDGFWTFADDGTPTPAPLPEFVDDYGHGTAVASLIAANVGDGFGMAGFGGATHVIAFRTCPHGLCLDTQLATALLKLDSLGVRIVTMSLGGKALDPTLRDAIHKVAADGVLIVASAGNSGASFVDWPAADLQPSGGGRAFGLAVGATTVQGIPAGFSSSGRHLSLVAPGSSDGGCVGVLVALPPVSELTDPPACWRTFIGAGGARYGYLSGTSFSAPEVAGVAALIWAVRPELKNYQVADIIKQSARRDPAAGWTPTMGCGLLDAGAALELATSLAASAAAASGTGSTACSTEGNQPATWPTELNQTITFKFLADKTLGDPDFTVRAAASSRLPVSFAANGDCRVNRATVHLVHDGMCTITASQAGNLDYYQALEVPRSFMIAPARPCVVPNVVGKTLRAAKTAINKRHCRTGRVSHDYSTNTQKGKVSAQSRRPRQVMPSGSKIDLVVSRGQHA